MPRHSPGVPMVSPGSTNLWNPSPTLLLPAPYPLKRSYDRIWADESATADLVEEQPDTRYARRRKVDVAIASNVTVGHDGPQTSGHSTNTADNHRFRTWHATDNDMPVHADLGSSQPGDSSKSSLRDLPVDCVEHHPLVQLNIITEPRSSTTREEIFGIPISEVPIALTNESLRSVPSYSVLPTSKSHPHKSTVLPSWTPVNSHHKGRHSEPAEMRGGGVEQRTKNAAKTMNRVDNNSSHLDLGGEKDSASDSQSDQPMLNNMTQSDEHEPPSHSRSSNPVLPTGSHTENAGQGCRNECLGSRSQYSNATEFDQILHELREFKQQNMELRDQVFQSQREKPEQTSYLQNQINELVDGRQIDSQEQQKRKEEFASQCSQIITGQHEQSQQNDTLRNDFAGQHKELAEFMDMLKKMMGQQEKLNPNSADSVAQLYVPKDVFQKRCARLEKALEEVADLQTQMTAQQIDQNAQLSERHQQTLSSIAFSLTEIQLKREGLDQFADIHAQSSKQNENLQQHSDRQAKKVEEVVNILQQQATQKQRDSDLQLAVVRQITDVRSQLSELQKQAVVFQTQTVKQHKKLTQQCASLQQEYSSLHEDLKRNILTLKELIQVTQSDSTIQLKTQLESVENGMCLKIDSLTSLITTLVALQRQQLCREIEGIRTEFKQSHTNTRPQAAVIRAVMSSASERSLPMSSAYGGESDGDETDEEHDQVDRVNRENHGQLRPAWVRESSGGDDATSSQENKEIGEQDSPGNDSGEEEERGHDYLTIAGSGDDQISDTREEDVVPRSTAFFDVKLHREPIKNNGFTHPYRINSQPIASGMQWEKLKSLKTFMHGGEKFSLYDCVWILDIDGISLRLAYIREIRDLGDERPIQVALLWIYSETRAAKVTRSHGLPVANWPVGKDYMISNFPSIEPMTTISGHAPSEKISKTQLSDYVFYVTGNFGKVHYETFPAVIFVFSEEQLAENRIHKK